MNITTKSHKNNKQSETSLQGQIKSIGIHYHKDYQLGAEWRTKIVAWLSKKFPKITIDPIKPDAVIILGGDGTILEAVGKFKKHGPLFLGMNLGHVGFLASVRDQKKFLNALGGFLGGKYTVLERMMLSTDVQRKDKIVFSSKSLNEVVIKSPLGMVHLSASIEDHPVQYIRGTGIMISTATGSTAYNLSAHGPVVMPDIKCFIITELSDHNIPTPSMVVKYNNKIIIKIVGFKKRGLLSISKTGEKFDVALISDGAEIFPMEEGDSIITRSSDLIKFVELEKHYFFKSLEEKFGFK